MVDLLVDPGVGDPAGIRRLAADRDDEVDDLDLVVQRGSAAVVEAAPPVWEGAARDAFVEALERALRLDPGYRLAVLLERLVDHGVRFPVPGRRGLGSDAVERAG